MPLANTLLNSRRLVRAPSHSRGFTLIELMITVAVIGVLAAVALPSYTEYVKRQKRADAQTQLLAAKLWMERTYSTNLRYDDPASAGNPPPGFSNQPFVKSPTEGATNYTIELKSVNRNSYTLRAKRQGSMASDACGDFTLTHTDTRGLENSTKTVAECWR